MAERMDADQELYRTLMTAPDECEEGFTWTSLAGAIFIALVMVPGSIYMYLMAGIGLGNAAQWVMVILFIEIAKRTHKVLSKPQIFVLFYMSTATLAIPMNNLLWYQYFARSEPVVGQGLAELIPTWIAPADHDIINERNFFHPAWYPVIGMILFKMIFSRIDNAILGFIHFRLTSDYERLPFPMAVIGAQGVSALAEDMEERRKGGTSSRWQAFSIGGAIGLAFGFLYLGVPTLTSAFFGKTIQIFPIPFADWVGKTEDLLPAVATGMSYDMSHFIMGMVLPFWAVMGHVLGVAITFIMNPFLRDAGILQLWQPGNSTVETLFNNRVDFYFSFGLGISIAIASIGLGSVVAKLRRQALHKEDATAVHEIPKGRVSPPLKWVGLLYFFTTLFYILFSGYLVGWHRGMMIFLFIYGFLYTPVISYAVTRIEGILGQTLPVPLVREAGILLSGYQGLACWYIPMPFHHYGRAAMFYRQAELTGTRFTSIWKTEIILIPAIMVSMIVYAQFIWSMGEIPSAAYPYAEKMWDLNAKNQVLLYSSTAGGYSQFYEAFNVWYLGAGWAAAMVLYVILWSLAAPTFLVFGTIKGLDQTMPHIYVMEFAGALMSRFYMERIFGRVEWKKRVPTISAGFACGAGLIGMFCIGVKFMATSVFRLPY
jgi:hypothetical protein